MTVPSAVIFDLGKVLLDFDYRIVVNRLAAGGSQSAPAVDRFLLGTPLLFEYESGQLDSEAFFHRLRDELGLRLDYPAFRAMFGDIFQPIPEMIAAQRDLRDRGIPTYILSNTNEIAVTHIRRHYPFFGGFNGYVFSHEVGVMKPAEPIYSELEKLAGLRGDALLYLDDRQENIDAATARGWRALLHTSPAASLGCLRELRLLD